MSNREMTTTGTTAVALRFNGGAVIASDRRGTVDSDSVFYEYCEATDVPMKLAMLGTTRASVIAGPSGEVLRSIQDSTRDRLVKAERAKMQLETVTESADYLCRLYGADRDPPHVEMIVAGWDNVNKEGAPCIWYSNVMCGGNVALNKSAGPGRDFALHILARHKISMSEKMVVQLAEKALLEAAIGYGKKGGSLDVCVIKDGRIIKESQLMSEVAKKYDEPL